MSLLRCWQLTKQKTSSNVQENHLVDEETTPPYGQENSSFDLNRQTKKKNGNKTVGKKHVGAFSLIDPFKKAKKKDGDKSLENVDGRANGVGHQKRAKVPPPFSGKKVSWDMATASCTDTDDQPQRKDSKGSYDYIDADECHDVVHHHSSTPFYPKRHSTHIAHPCSSHHAPVSSSSSPQSRYDYLDFAGKTEQTLLHHNHKRMQQQQQRPQRVAVPPPLRRAAASADEPLYATASSQIYSLGGSEDPYSSIVSIGGGYGSGSTAYDQHGYSRIVSTNKNGVGTSKTAPVPSETTMLARVALRKNNGPNNFTELDQLYAKIDRKASAAHQQPTTSALIAQQLLRRQQSFQHQPQQCSAEFGGGDGGESGSGSICSSTQPSYRYLTVREDAAVIRERIREREEQEQHLQQQRANLGQQLEQDRDDAYYSTIGNEYETVGDGNTNMSANIDIQQTQQQQHNVIDSSLSSFSSFRQPIPPPQPQNRLSLNVDFAERNSASSPTPLPPTSPIPKLQPQMLQHNCTNHHQKSSSSPTAKVPMPPPPPPTNPPPFIHRPIVMENSPPSNRATPLTNGSVAKSPKKSSSSALRLSFFNGSPLNFFNHSNSKVIAEKPASLAPPILPPPKAVVTNSETNGLLNGTGKAAGNNGTKNVPTKRHHSRIPIFNRHNNVAVGIQRTRTPSPATTSAASSTATATVTANCADVGTQTVQHQLPRHQLMSKASTAAAKLTTTATRDKFSSSVRRSSPLPVQVGQDYVSTIELSKKGGAGGGDQRGWPLKSTTMTTSTSSAC